MLVRHIDPVIHPMGCPEIEGASLNRKQAVRAPLDVVLDVHVRLDLEEMVHHVTALGTLHIEVRMVRKIDDGRLVGSCMIIDPQDIVLVPGISHGDITVSGIALLPVRAQTMEADSGDTAFEKGLGIPHETVETLGAACSVPRQSRKKNG